MHSKLNPQDEGRNPGNLYDHVTFIGYSPGNCGAGVLFFSFAEAPVPFFRSSIFTSTFVLFQRLLDEVTADSNYTGAC